jgi:hypothetical protein
MLAEILRARPLRNEFFARLDGLTGLAGPGLLRRV